MTKKVNKKFSWRKAAVGVATLVIVAGSVTVAKRVIDPGELVTGVIDGDTLRLSNKQTVRLLSVDAPEIQYCFGTEAKKALENKVLRKKVILKDLRTDFYRRIVSLVYVDGELVNQYLAKNGFAYYNGDVTVASDIIKTDSHFARENKLGIFSETCSPSKPIKAECNIKAQIQHDTNKKIYLLPGCRDYTQTLVERYRGEDWFCTEKDAVAAGFTKSLNCK